MGRRPALLIIAGGALLLLAAGLAFRTPLLARWRAFQAEREVRRKLAEVQTVQFVSGVPLDDVLRTLSMMSRVQFSWGGDGQPRKYPLPAFQLDRKSLEEVLEHALQSIEGHSFRYSVTAKGVVVEEVPAAP